MFSMQCTISIPQDRSMTGYLEEIQILESIKLYYRSTRERHKTTVGRLTAIFATDVLKEFRKVLEGIRYWH